jgi:hypothetical protein
MNKLLLFLLIIGMILLHQDFWLWKNKTLILGVLPIGLAYHVCYSILASLVMILLVRFAWHKQLEELESHHENQPR